MPKEWHFVSKSCDGETCACGAPATHKVGEEIPYDDPIRLRHNFTAYVCCACFRRIMGDAVDCPEPYKDLFGVTAVEALAGKSAPGSFKALYGQTPAELYAEMAQWPSEVSTEPEPPEASDADLDWNGDLR